MIVSTKAKAKRQSQCNKTKTDTVQYITHVVGNKCFHVTPVDFQPGSLDQQSVCFNATRQHDRREFRR